MTLNRRHFLMFLGAGAGSIALQPLMNGQRILSGQADRATAQTLSLTNLSFQPIKGPMPLTIEGMDRAKQTTDYSNFTVADDIVLPEGYVYDLIAAWGDPVGLRATVPGRVGDSRFGYNNDYLSLIETAPGEGFLTVNHEYISAKPWLQTFQEVVGKALPLSVAQAAVEAAGEDGVNAFELPQGDASKGAIEEISREALIDLGLSVISVRKGADGKWMRTNSRVDRRITGISGLEDGRYLKATGPAVAVFTKSSGQGYQDGLGDRIIGTFNNCSGGTTPWGTVFSAEENFQDFVPEPVYADGTSLPPSERTFSIDDEAVSGLGNAFGLAGNKYGWMVEIDPANPNDYGTKHTWLGRYRHEAVGVRAVAGKKLAFYSGCDRRGGHVYKFVSNGTVQNPQDKANSQLLSDGMLYVAKFNPNGTGRWIPLQVNTPIDPELPSIHAGGMIPLPNPDRAAGSVVKVSEDAAIASYKQQFKTLGDLYQGNPTEKQGAILIDAHFAANAVGGTCTARPEDTDVRPDGKLFIAFTSGSPSSSDGSPNKEVFKGPNGETTYEYGWIMRLDEDGNDPAAITFKWSTFATGGEPHEGGLGFANPDNLEFDAKGNLWIVTDMSSDRLNREIPARTEMVDGVSKPVSQSNLRGLFGNNSIWMMPTSGANAGQAYLFGFGPMDSELTGPFFTQDNKTLFIAAQHPGEVGGRRENMASETRRYAMKTTDGQEFTQVREVPLGSNWPGKQPNNPPKPAVVAIRRTDGATLS
ncbi:PhoX family protein [Leptolyngbya ohadii]|uniref:PhoX family protein n=1 Tax=Leptolyngbya ohadii TaxID=1962290 RepID=UPI000B5A172C|nr:alkaline phosphatase PhoX [Leptolyngbya ohadii]